MLEQAGDLFPLPFFHADADNDAKLLLSENTMADNDVELFLSDNEKADSIMYIIFTVEEVDIQYITTVYSVVTQQ